MIRSSKKIRKSFRNLLYIPKSNEHITICWRILTLVFICISRPAKVFWASIYIISRNFLFFILFYFIIIIYLLFNFFNQWFPSCTCWDGYGCCSRVSFPCIRYYRLFLLYYNHHILLLLLLLSGEDIVVDLDYSFHFVSSKCRVI